MEVKRYVQEYANDILTRLDSIDTEWAKEHTKLIKRVVEMHKRYMVSAIEAVQHITKINNGAYGDKEE